MLDSDFWHQYAKDFRALDPSGQYLWASWSADLDNAGRASPPTWTLRGVGDPGHHIEVLFNPMARRAAARLGASGNLLNGWLDAVRDRIGGDSSGSGFRTNPDETRTEHIGGTLLRLCVLSAELCSQLESEALERESVQPTQANLPKGYADYQTSHGPDDETDREAISILESKPGFAKASSRIFDRLKPINIGQVRSITQPGSIRRKLAVLKAFDVRAGSMLTLVDDLTSQKAYVRALAQICRVTWEELTDIPFSEANNLSLDAQYLWGQLIERARHWENRSFKKLARMEAPRRVSLPKKQKASATSGEKRKRRSAMIESPSAVIKIEAHLKVIRDKKGTTISQFVLQAGITDRTLRNLLDTKKAKPDTFRSVAKAMGTDFQTLIS